MPFAPILQPVDSVARESVPWFQPSSRFAVLRCPLEQCGEAAPAPGLAGAPLSRASRTSSHLTGKEVDDHVIETDGANQRRACRQRGQFPGGNGNRDLRGHAVVCRQSEIPSGGRAWEACFTATRCP